MSAITVHQLYKSYTEDKEVLKNISLEIRDGEFMVLVGPSGCGKSTLLRTIAGLEEISKGDIHIGDRIVNDLPAKDRNIAMVFQNYALYPHMNVFQNLAFGLKLRKMDKKAIDSVVAEAAEILEIEDLLKRKPKELSGGQRQRVALGRAIVRKPDVFLFDEPLSNLDAKLRVQMRAEIKKLHRRLGTTMIYVTHDQVEAMTMGDRIVVLKDGVVQQVGTPVDVYEEPSNRFVGSFIGSPPMNFLSGTVRQRHFHSETIEFDLPRQYTEKGIERSVTVGVRPSDLTLDDSGQAFSLLVAEPLGDETVLHLETDSENLVVKVNTRELGTVPDTVRLSVKTENIHVFDQESGKRIS